jgi:hypothetical protein
LVFFPITQAETRFLTHRTSFRIVSDTTSLITLPTGIFVVVVFFISFDIFLLGRGILGLGLRE